MGFSVIIPARYASSRFPGKPLAELQGRPMIQHVYERACESEADRIFVATDDQRIADVARGFGAEVCMTSPDHPSGTDRLQQVVHELGFYADDIVVNVQGDEPMVPPRIINQVAHNLKAEPEASIATLSEKIHDVESLMNPNVVKVVSDIRGMALFSVVRLFHGHVIASLLSKQITCQRVSTGSVISEFMLTELSFSMTL
jgi:3-deoxy-manno-octulosonate cytidylyltransferase (CMP-KDO synthetase)